MGVYFVIWRFVGLFEALGRIDEFKMKVSLVLIFVGIITSVAAGYINPEWAVSSIISWFVEVAVGATIGEVIGELIKAFAKR